MREGGGLIDLLQQLWVGLVSEGGGNIPAWGGVSERGRGKIPARVG